MQSNDPLRAVVGHILRAAIYYICIKALVALAAGIAERLT